MNQQGDVLFFNTEDGGDINVAGGITEMTTGFESAAYIALFGGNLKDDGRKDNRHTYWGNLIEDQPENRVRSETQFLLRSLPATSYNLNRVRDAVKKDLNFFLTLSIASSVEVTVTIPAVNMIKIVINVNAEGQEQRFSFIENWKSKL